MAQKVLIDGTGYELAGGKSLMGGTGYEIKKGKCLTDGTGYEVPIESAVVVSLAVEGSAGGPSRYAGIVYAGTTYQAGTTTSFEAKRGETLTIIVAAWKNGGYYPQYNKITVDGNTVSPNSNGEYDLVLAANTTVTFTGRSGFAVATVVTD